MPYPYIVVDNSNDKINETLQMLQGFSDFYCIGSALSNDEGLNLILEKQPLIVFLGIDASQSSTSLFLLLQLHQFLDILPYFVVLADSKKQAYESIKAGVFDFLMKPLAPIDLTKCVFRIRKTCFSDPPQEEKKADTGIENPELKQNDAVLIEDNSMRICIKSYGDYQFISLNEVVYLKADNNTTDFYLSSGRKLTAYKTLKHYENNLPANFYRIHNSYIVNSSFITRISTGKSLCYLNGNDISVSFSKTYKENIDILIRNISTDYL